MIENAGAFAGRIWTALNETEGLTLKEIKTKAKLKEKELYLGLGWLLREDKIFGCGLTYGYDSLIGPIEASVYWSDRTDKVGFFVNFGYNF